MLDEWLSLTLDEAEPAVARTGSLPGGHYRVLGRGLLELTPAHRTPDARSLVLSAGIHGNETAPIELLGEWLAALESGRLTLGAPILVILGNLPAIRAQTRFLTTNLNRLFRRDLEATGDEPARARELMQAVDEFFTRHSTWPLHLDMHTAIRDSRYPRFAVVPYTEESPDAYWPALAGAGLQAVLFQHQHSWTFSHYSRHYHHAEAYTLELGKVQPFGANDLEALEGMRNWLAALGEGRAAPAGSLESLHFFRVAHELMRHSEQFTLGFAEDVANFTEFPAGTTLAEDARAGAFLVDGAPLAVVFPNANVEIGARAALLVRPTPAPEPGG
ncbi:succinylglutamate desuccinylase [Salinicola avicenniae]|uniref:succinylglutamate desuccinylase n=1 Tax=Salinicola avicenniae TaxID=2916836 RepID=UPI002073D8A3|nr:MULTISPECIES: succinylglutamate desuccinylase [unclassified Salinicola]